MRVASCLCVVLALVGACDDGDESGARSTGGGGAPGGGGAESGGSAGAGGAAGSSGGASGAGSGRASGTASITGCGSGSTVSSFTDASTMVVWVRLTPGMVRRRGSSRRRSGVEAMRPAV